MKIRKCPACKSKTLNFEPWRGVMYKCKKCGYLGPLAIEEEV